MRYYFYCTDNNHDLNVALVFKFVFSLIVRILIILKVKVNDNDQGLSRALTARAGKSNLA